MAESITPGTTTMEKKVTISQNLIMGLQHVLTMCPGSIAVPLIMSGPLGLDAKTTAYLVAANLFTSAIAILIQVYGLGKHIGSKLPIVLGSAFAPQRQGQSRKPPSPLVFLLISTHFTATPGILLPSPALKKPSFKCHPGVEPRSFTPDLSSRLRALYAQ